MSPLTTTHCLCPSVDLLSLLRWKSNPEGIFDTLNGLERVDGAETVKFLQDVLDALFSMFSTEEGNSTQHSGHVFHSLVSETDMGQEKWVGCGRVGDMGGVLGTWVGCRKHGWGVGNIGGVLET